MVWPFSVKISDICVHLKTMEIDSYFLKQKIQQLYIDVAFSCDGTGLRRVLGLWAAQTYTTVNQMTFSYIDVAIRPTSF